jgi:hypothetical protein
VTSEGEGWTVYMDPEDGAILMSLPSGSLRGGRTYWADGPDGAS